MDVVSHQTKSMDQIMKPFPPFLYDEVEAEAVLITRKDVLSCVPSKDHMIYGAGKIEARFSCHGDNLA
jgi:hypothetical protein